MKKRLSFLMLVGLLAIGLVACQEDGTGSDAATPATSAETADSSAESSDETSDDSAESDNAAPTAEPTEEPTPEPTPIPAKSIAICMGTEPLSLFPYGDTGLTASAVRHAVYEPPLTSLSYAYQPVALEKVPSLADGDAYFERITVNEGDRVVDTSGNIVRLLDEVEVVDADGNVVVFAGEPIEMEQLVVEFALKPLVWSDGTPVSAEDSVFSFQVAASPEIAIGKQGVNQTASYTATGPLSLEWRGVAGLRHADYQKRVWSPLPSHQLSELTVAEMRSAEIANRYPLSSGPFVVESWENGEMQLVANPHYYREGLPSVDALTVRFGDAETLDLEACDVVTHDATTPELVAAAGEEWISAEVPGSIYEQISFGIRPVFEIDSTRPAWFDDARVRQAMTMCTDRAGMAADLVGDSAEVLNAFVPASHPLLPDDLAVWEYDPAAGNALLDEAGFRDYAGDGRRQDLTTGFPMTITIGTNAESGLRQQIVERFQANMQACGIPVESYTRTAGSFYAAGPLGPVFGRQFDLAAFAWLTDVVPQCGLFLSDNLTGPVELEMGGWNNINVTGYENEAYDVLCRAAQQALPGGEGYAENQTAALQLFNQELPMIPLFTNVKTLLARPSVLNLAPDQLQPSELWNVAEWDIEESS